MNPLFDPSKFDDEIKDARRYERGLLVKLVVALLLVAAVAVLHELSLHWP